MKVEIWSDVVCPFCYIGKRRFEEAMRRFDHSSEVTVEWKSFQLNPDLETNPDISISEYLAQAKGWTDEQVEQMNERITRMAAETGLQYNLDKTVAANSFDAHRLIQFAKTENLAGETAEALFGAYFIEGKNLDDRQMLLDIASGVGLDVETAEQMLNADNFSGAVEKNIREAERMNIRGVPFYLFNRQYAISGARPPERFEKALKKARNENRPAVEISTFDGTSGP